MADAWSNDPVHNRRLSLFQFRQMINHNSYEYGRREYHRTHEDNGALALVVLAVAVLGIGYYLLVSRFHNRTNQIAELSFYLIALAAAGRLHQLRVLDPFRPEVSIRFNPLYNKGGSSQELVNAFFESFLQRQDFFRGHQAAYLSDICRVLDYTGKIYNIPDILVMARDEQVLKEQISTASRVISNHPNVSQQRSEERRVGKECRSRWSRYE